MEMPGFLPPPSWYGAGPGLTADQASAEGVEGKEKQTPHTAPWAGWLLLLPQQGGGSSLDCPQDTVLLGPRQWAESAM